MNFQDDKLFIETVKEIWEFLCPSENVVDKSYDAIFVFGGLTLDTPKHAAYLYKKNVARKILVSGNSGPLSRDVYSKPEAEVFADEMIANGVLKDDIIIETKATNTGENVILGMEKLEKELVNVRSLVLVARSFLMRRCLATFEKHFPEIKCIPSLPDGNVLTTIDRSRIQMAKRLIEEIERLEKYQSTGFIAPVKIPDNVKIAQEKLNTILKENEQS